MHPSGSTRQTTPPLRTCLIPELAHLIDQTHSPVPLWNRALIKSTSSTSNISINKKRSQQQPPLSLWTEQFQDGHLRYSALPNNPNVPHYIVKDKHSHGSLGRNTTDNFDYKLENGEAICILRQYSSHETLERLEQCNPHGDDSERCSSPDNHNRVLPRNCSYLSSNLPSPDKFSAYPLYLRQQAVGTCESALSLSTNRWDMHDRDTELDSVPMYPAPVPPRKGSDTPYPTDLIPQRTLPPRAEDPTSRFPKGGFKVVDRVTGSALDYDFHRNSTVPNMLSESSNGTVANSREKGKAPIKACLEQTSSDLINHPSEKTLLHDSQELPLTDAIITPNQIDFVPQTRPILPTPSHTPAQSWSENTSAHITTAGSRAYDSNTPLHIAKQRYATIEQALSDENKKINSRKEITDLVSALAYPDLSIHANSPNSQFDTFSSDDIVSYDESPTYTHASLADAEDEIPAISLLSEPEVLSAIEARIIPIGPHSVRMRSIRRTKGTRALNENHIGQQHQPAHNDSGISMGLDSQTLSQVQKLATSKPGKLPSRLASIHFQGQQKQLHQYGFARKRSASQFSGISCQSPLRPEHIEHESSSTLSKQRSASPDIGSPPAIRGRKDGLPYVPKFTERMELDGPATLRSPDPNTANIEDKEYEGEVYPENVESQDHVPNDDANVDSPSANNSASRVGGGSSTKTVDQTPAASSPVAQYHGTEGSSAMGKGGAPKRKVKKMKARVKREWIRTKCRQNKACTKLKRRLRRLKGCDAP